MPRLRWFAVVWVACLGVQARGDESASSAAWRTTAVAVDELLDRRLATAGVSTSPPADDAEFLRRAYLDLHGVIPPRDVVLSFLIDPSADKRTQLVEQLVTDPRYGAHLADVWDNRLIAPGANQRFRVEAFAAWLAESFNGRPWNEIAYDLLTARGSQDENPAVVFMLKGREPLNPAEMVNLVGRSFLGVQLTCAQCHDHPFTNYRQADFWGLAGFYEQMEMPGRGRVRSFGIDDNPEGAYHLTAYEDRAQMRPPQALGLSPLLLDDQPVYRVELARWVTSPDNPYFARAMANRMWQHFFGRGLVEPVDDMHPDNEPTHPEVLDLLAREFAASGYDVKFLCRTITSTRAYGRTSRPSANNADDDTLLSHQAVRPLTPGQLYDSLSALFGAPSRPQSGSPGRASQNPRVEFTEFFAREVDAPPTRYENGIPQLLRLMNSSQFFLVQGRQMPGDGSSAERIDRLYLSALARLPTDDEAAFCQDHLTAGGGLDDVLWSLVNSSEFLLNH